MQNKKSNKYWEDKLTAKQFHILREKGTEPPFSGKYLHKKDKGIYVCAACEQELFTSDDKYDSSSGWPSFCRVASKGKVELVKDINHNMTRTEVLCSNCGSHLGHLFSDGPEPEGKRYCINSLCLSFKEKDKSSIK